MSDMNEEQMRAMVADLEEGEPFYTVQAAWDDISLWLIENRPVDHVETLDDGTEFVVQKPWDWEETSDTIVLFGHPVYSSAWSSVPSKDVRDNAVDEAMVLGTRQVHQGYIEDGGVQTGFTA